MTYDQLILLLGLLCNVGAFLVAFAALIIANVKRIKE